MEAKKLLDVEKFENYVNSFAGLTDEQKKNFKIKKEHSLRVAEISETIAQKLKFNESDIYLAYLIGLYHDIGRFEQLKEFGTFNDEKSVDHAELSVKVLDNGFLNSFDEPLRQVMQAAIFNHNKRSLPKELSEYESGFAKIVRDADKLDIYKVITEYYSNSKITPNHTLTWEMPKSNVVSKDVAKSVMKGEIVAKENIKSDIDIKVLQLSWVYDLNYKYSFELAIENRYFEKIYNSMPKNDTVIDIYRKVKVFAENKVSA